MFEQRRGLPGGVGSCRIEVPRLAAPLPSPFADQETHTVSRSLPVRLYAVAAAAAVALVLTACTPASSDTASYHACLDESTLQFTSIATSAGDLDCGPDGVPVSWLAAGADSAVPTMAATASADAKGPKGDTGEPGTDGKPGASGPAGLPGQAGAAGKPGAAGPAGPAGAAGQAGAAGAAGSTGATGATGPAGEQGATGPAGEQGVTGPAGAPGAAGPSGAPGPSGPAGERGPTGPAGLPGRDGNSIHNGSGTPDNSLGIDGDFYLNTTTFAIYGPKTAGTWPVGAQSLIGPQGPMGPQGVQGDPGVQGPAGSTGAAGPTGAAGSVGPQGQTGPQGPAGPQGPEGPAGPVGPVGPQGPQGPAGAGTVFVSFLPGTIDPAAFANGAAYFPISGSVAPSSSRAANEIRVPRAGTITEMRVEMTERSSSIDVYLVRDGLFQPAMSCTTTSQCGRTGSLAVAQNQKLVLWVRGVGPAPIENLRVSLLFE